MALLLVGGGWRRVCRHMGMDAIHDAQRWAGLAVLPLLPLSPWGVDDSSQQPLRGDPAGGSISFNIGNESFHRGHNGGTPPPWQGETPPWFKFAYWGNFPT